MQDLRTPVLLSGFVLGLQPSGVLLTFPELLAPPEGLDIEAHATLCYRNHSGRHTAVGHVLRVVAGPPVTVTFKHPVPMTTRSPAPPRQDRREVAGIAPRRLYFGVPAAWTRGPARLDGESGRERSVRLDVPVARGGRCPSPGRLAWRRERGGARTRGTHCRERGWGRPQVWRGSRIRARNRDRAGMLVGLPGPLAEPRPQIASSLLLHARHAQQCRSSCGAVVYCLG